MFDFGQTQSLTPFFGLPKMKISNFRPILNSILSPNLCRISGPISSPILDLTLDPTMNPAFGSNLCPTFSSFLGPSSGPILIKSLFMAITYLV